jgi:hypothetical protein
MTVINDIESCLRYLHLHHHSLSTEGTSYGNCVSANGSPAFPSRRQHLQQSCFPSFIFVDDDNDNNLLDCHGLAQSIIANTCTNV